MAHTVHSVVNFGYHSTAPLTVGWFLAVFYLPGLAAWPTLSGLGDVNKKIARFLLPESHIYLKPNVSIIQIDHVNIIIFHLKTIYNSNPICSYLLLL